MNTAFKKTFPEIFPEIGFIMLYLNVFITYKYVP